MELNQTGLSLPIKVVKVGEPPYDGDGWDKSKPYYLVDGADGTVLCGVTESFKEAFEYMAQCTNSHAPVIDADELKNVQAERDDFKFLRSEASKASKKYKAELETVSQANKLLTDRLRDAGEVANKAETALGTANKRIAELEVEND